MAEATKEAAPKQNREPDHRKLIDGLREELVVLRGELEAVTLGNKAVLDRQEFVDRMLQKHEQQRRSQGKNEWWLYDRRKETKPPVIFFSAATSPRDALADYQRRTGHRYVGQGSNPFYCKPPEVVSKAKDE
jgi:hypothetical protein